MAYDKEQPIYTILDGFDARLALLEGGVTPGPATLPRQADIVSRWSADAITGTADNTPVSSWTDSVSGATMTAPSNGARPTYRTGGQNGKPYLSLAGGQYFNGQAGAPASLAMESGDFTVLIFVRNVGSTGHGRWWNGVQGNDPVNVTANGTVAGGGGLAPGGNANTLPYSGSGFLFVGQLRSTSTGVARGIIQGTLTSAFPYGPPGSGSSASIGGADYFDVSAKGELYEVLVWKRGLVLPEVLQAIKYGCDKYGLPYPWAGTPFKIFDGDSIFNNEGGTNGAVNALPARVAATNNYPLGTYSSLSVSGQPMTNMVATAPSQVDPVKAVIGVPVYVTVMEWANMRTASTSDAIQAATNYITGRKSAGVDKVYFVTSTAGAAGFTGYDASKRAAYNQNDWLAAGADVQISLHLDPSVGVEGACPAQPGPYTPYFNDQLHPNDAGTAAMAAYIAPRMTP